ncbi:MAG: glycosyltransferase, partial [Gammaproteobacteria bacterium]|nr:glycosyltransferase [Gammaproteobacteria bacterium]
GGCGLPLVVTDVPGNRDIIRDTGGGLIVRNKDTDDMSEALYKLLTDERERARLADIAYQQSSRYDWSYIADQYLDVYRGVIDGDARRMSPPVF